jgi:hypothetical protein
LPELGQDAMALNRTELGHASGRLSIRGGRTR